MPADDPRTLDAAAATRLVDFAECARAGDWTLRSALVRYAQRFPVAASAVLELVRRTDRALQPFRRSLERLPVADVDTANSDASPSVVQLLVVAQVLDDLAELLTQWANDPRAGEPPVSEVDALAGVAFTQLADLGIERETRPPRRAG